MTTSTQPAIAPLTAYEGSCSDIDRAVGPAIRDVLDRIGGKWALLIINTLRHRTLRYSELLEHIPGVSQRMLTRTLRQLERDGLVSRTVYGEVPPRVEYALTDTGGTLIEPAIALANWAIDNYPGITASRERYDARSAS